MLVIWGGGVILGRAYIWGAYIRDFKVLPTRHSNSNNPAKIPNNTDTVLTCEYVILQPSTVPMILPC